MSLFLSNLTTRPVWIGTLLLAFVALGCSSTDTGQNGPSFDSSSLQPGDTFSFTFQSEGTFSYYCRNHEPDMTGSITVSADAETSGPDTVAMQNLQFEPSHITVAPNTEVVWTNQENESVQPHTVTSGEPGQDTNPGY